MKEAVIVSAVRTPLGSFNGSLAGIGATDLGAIVIEEAVKRADIEKAEVNEVIMGQVLPCGYGQNPAKQAAVRADLPWTTECITVNKVCGSALKTVMLAAQAVQLGDADVVVAGGMENMSMAPYYLEKARFGYRMGPGQLQDHRVLDEAVDRGRGRHGVLEDLVPLREDQVARDHHAATLVSFGEQGEEHLHLLAVLLHIADVVDDDDDPAGVGLGLHGRRLDRRRGWRQTARPALVSGSARSGRARPRSGQGSGQSACLR